MGVLNEDDLGPDGVRFVVDWDAMKCGDSIFVPCINVNLARRQTEKIFLRKGWQVRFQVQIKSHILGLRIWRTT